MQYPILGEVVACFEEILASPATRAAFTRLDAVDLMEIFTKRARVLKSPPAFLKGAFRSYMRLALQEAECGRAEHRSSRGGINLQEDTAGAVSSVRAGRVVTIVGSK